MPGPIDPQVLATLVAHHRRFLDFLVPRVGGRAEAEDVLQAAFVRGLERGAGIRDGESAVAWFYRLLRNALVDRWRRREVERRALERSAGEAADAMAPPPELEDLVCQCVHGLIPTLGPGQADILRRVEVEGRPVADVAAELGVTANAAAVRLHRARRALRQRLQTACGTCTEHGCLACSCGGPSDSRGLAPT